MEEKLAQLVEKFNSDLKAYEKESGVFVGISRHNDFEGPVFSVDVRKTYVDYAPANTDTATDEAKAADQAA